MGLSAVQIILLVIFGCVAGMGSVLDSFQTHRPLIACTIVGLILGDVKTGVLLGGTLEMIALGWMNIGAAQSPDSALASIISTILVIVGQQSISSIGSMLFYLIKLIRSQFPGCFQDFSRNCNCTSSSSGRAGINRICSYRYDLLPACSR